MLKSTLMGTMGVLFVGSTITVPLAVMLLLSLHKRSTHPRILIISVSYQLAYAVIGTLHSACSLFWQIFGSEANVNEQIIFWTVTPLYSLRLVLPITSFFLTFDRLCAMRFPIKYNSWLKRSLTIMCVGVTATLTVGNFVAYLTNRKISPASAYVFGHYVHFMVIHIFNDVYAAVCLVNLPATFLFLRRFYQFSKRQRLLKTMSTVQYRRVYSVRVNFRT
ncbi:hypothetical protein L596_023007 [Steinernema carpocapsae]|uniref:G-protein coupled receptors family 1 profile domain-containing protein n=1 Tax=Steinernema carpocapsae TaxID=34508 RepID=A0A4U5MCK3_STECR|nr:hypothetical protein L596_023007 [Steinernema carpocapsae]